MSDTPTFQERLAEISAEDDCFSYTLIWAREKAPQGVAKEITDIIEFSEYLTRDTIY